jgi:hypothetical protein
MRLLSPFCLIGIGIATLSLAPQAYAQRAPAIPGFNGTIVTEETAKQEKKAEDKAAVAIKDAFTREETGPLADLKTGMTVVVRYGTEMNEGVVSKIERSTNEITVRYEDKRLETLVLAEKTTPDARTVEYTDEAKQKITRYFKPKS